MLPIDDARLKFGSSPHRGGSRPVLNESHLSENVADSQGGQGDVIFGLTFEDFCRTRENDMGRCAVCPFLDDDRSGWIGLYDVHGLLLA